MKPGCVAVVGDEDDEHRRRRSRPRPARSAPHSSGAAAPSSTASANCAADGGRVVDLRTPRATYEELFLPLYGAYQGDNAAGAVAAAEAFFGVALDAEVVAEALAAARVPGRLEMLGRRPLVVLDGAHNPAGADRARRGPGRGLRRRPADVVVVIGCLNGRDPRPSARRASAPTGSPRRRLHAALAAGAARRARSPGRGAGARARGERRRLRAARRSPRARGLVDGGRPRAGHRFALPRRRGAAASHQARVLGADGANTRHLQARRRRTGPRRRAHRPPRAQGSAPRRRRAAHVDAEPARRHYEEHVEQALLRRLVAFITRSPALALVVEGPPDTVAVVRTLMGPTEPGRGPARLDPGRPGHRD